MASHDSEKAVGSVFFIDGKLVLKALPGFEPLFPSGFEAAFQARPPSPSLSPSPVQTLVKVEETPPLQNNGWTTVRKRSIYTDANVEEPSPKKQRSDRKLSVHEFRIGDVEGMKKFYYRRLGEVGINALRRIVTEWVKVLEPTRLRNYGPYHKLKQYSWDFKLLKSETPPREHRGPPWWPRDVPYVEPAHLPSKCTINFGMTLK
jgi:hypothetical protein